MSVEGSSGVNAGKPDVPDVGARYAVEMLRRAQEAQRVQGDASLRLINAAMPRMEKLPDGGISVRA